MKDNGTAPERSRDMKNGQIPDVKFWMDGGIQAWQSWTQSSTSMMKCSLELAQEIWAVSQAGVLIEKDAWNALTACRSPGDVFEFQKEYVKNAAARRVDEMSRINSKVISVISEATAQLREAATKP